MIYFKIKSVQDLKLNSPPEALHIVLFIIIIVFAYLLLLLLLLLCCLFNNIFCLFLYFITVPAIGFQIPKGTGLTSTDASSDGKTYVDVEVPTCALCICTE